MRRYLVPAGLCGALAALTCIYARRVEPRWLDVQRLTLSVPDLPNGLDGLRLAHLTDLHVTRHGPPSVLARALEAIEEARPELVVLTGDIVDRGPDVAVAADALAPLGSWTTFAVFGNHDYSAGPRYVGRMVSLLLARGIRPLRNEAVPYERRGSTLWIVGLDYPWRGRDEAAALAAVPPGARPRLLLAHSAEQVERLPSSSVDLALAGHTHGGQIYVPVLTRAFLRREFGGYGSGCYRVNGNPTYINRGLGSLGIEARFLRRPEVTVITLRPGDGTSVLRRHRPGDDHPR